MDQVNTAPTTETSAQPSEAPAPVEQQNDNAFLQKFSALARQEKAIREREANLAQREQGVSQFDELKNLAANDPDAFLAKFGLSYGALTERALKGPQKEDEIAQIKNEFSKFREEITNEARLKRENEEKAALVTVMRDIKGTLADKDDFELVNSHAAYDDVWELMCLHYNEHKKWISVEDAANEIEKELRAQADRFADTKYLKAKLSTPAPEQKQAGTSSVTTAPGNELSPGKKALLDAVASSGRTLSNNMAPQPANNLPQAMTPEQLRDKAMRAYRENRR